MLLEDNIYPSPRTAVPHSNLELPFITACDAELLISLWYHMKLDIPSASQKNLIQKPIILLYGSSAQGHERLFVHSLFHNLEENGLEGQIWLDWEEGQWTFPEMQLQRYISQHLAEISISFAYF